MTWVTPYHQDSDFSRPLSFEDKVKIFEEQVLGWQLDIADTCINGELEEMGHSGWAVLAIAFTYFEMIGKTKDGYSGDSRSRRYFDQGVLDVFPELASRPERVDVLTILYKHIRCGFYHAGVVHCRVTISSRFPHALDFVPQERRVLINPHLLIPVIKRHFVEYINCLRNPQEQRLRDNFEKRFNYLASFDPLAKATKASAP